MRRPGRPGLSIAAVCLAALLLGLCESDARPLLPRLRVIVDQFPLDVEVAASPETRQRGLQYRSALPPEGGMLFAYPDSDYRSFWMQNVFLPVDVAFFDERRLLLEVRTVAADAAETIVSREEARYVLVTNAGWFERNWIRRFAALKLPHPITAF